MGWLQGCPLSKASRDTLGGRWCDPCETPAKTWGHFPDCLLDWVFLLHFARGGSQTPIDSRPLAVHLYIKEPAYNQIKLSNFKKKRIAKPQIKANRKGIKRAKVLGLSYKEVEKKDSQKCTRTRGIALLIDFRA